MKYDWFTLEFYNIETYFGESSYMNFALNVKHLSIL